MKAHHFISEEEYVSQMETGALLNPRVDSTFKALFTQPTKESKAALHSFLEAATERKIRKYELKANDSPVGFDGQRGVSYDILCQFEDGLTADIEMQASDQEYDYGKRAEYQVARLETTYLQKGDNWEKAPVVYQISVLNFNYKGPTEKNRPNSKKSKNPVSRYAMRTESGRELSNTLNIIFIELPKAKVFEASLETNTALENWAIFLKEADNPQKQDLIQKLTNKEAGLMNAQKSLSNISANKDYWIAQYRQEMRDRDYRSGLSAAER
uniref:PD-(D/E)XK nuclease family transposase n=1 Tax=Treponema zioleckii TaxID=331680 RepID=UPI00168BB071